MIEWKKKYSHGGDGCVGAGYWQGFKKRNGHLIKSKKGKKNFELDCASWSTYANFKQIYEQVYDEMVDAGVAVKMASPA